jgi:hypothetical protein
MMAARKGGAGSENFHLRSVLHEAQKHNVPKSLIEKAIAKATGSNADAHEEIYYEGTAGTLYMLLSILNMLFTAHFMTHVHRVADTLWSFDCQSRVKVYEYTITNK